MWFVLSPLTWLLCGFVLFVAGVLPSRRRKWLWLPGAAVILASVVMMTPLAANVLVGWLEEMPDQPASCATDPPEVAVVLTGGVDRFTGSRDDFPALNMASRRRAEKAVNWWRERQSQRRLVVTGGPPGPHAVPEASLVAAYMRALGVPDGIILTETGATDTWQNARNVAAMRPALPRRVLLVTSAMHVRRAHYVMERAGFEVCVLATDWRYVPFRRLRYLAPDSGGLVKTEAALHELVGLVAYRLRRDG